MFDNFSEDIFPLLTSCALSTITLLTACRFSSLGGIQQSHHTLALINIHLYHGVGLILKDEQEDQFNTITDQCCGHQHVAVLLLPASGYDQAVHTIQFGRQQRTRGRLSWQQQQCAHTPAPRP